MTRIAFLGLGHMGLPMAHNLVKAGHEVHGFDLVPAAIDAARAAGIPVASSGADAVADADVVITMFPAGKHVIAAYRDELLAAAQAAPGSQFAWRTPAWEQDEPRPHFIDLIWGSPALREALDAGEAHAARAQLVDAQALRARDEDLLLYSSQ